ncbi:hypothetical protein JCM15548_13644 [Geofilum rubicundum JCM 15548]|uniref:DUF4292 domain-containing protein n=2 Tax=Geofilum TaxID=1236988 RepID=A0A0E9M2D8_9BACT|nr:hypothetical protein JCM15548_13644 [Geofilum rubicundum JCM 15548]
MRYLAYLVLLYFVGLSSCKSVDRLFTATAEDDLNETELVERIVDNQLVYEELFFKRVFAEIEKDGKNQGVRANIYLKKDSAIVISVIPVMGIELYRIMLTKTGIFFIDRMNRTVAESTYQALSRRFLVDFNYEQIQRILSNGVFTYPNNDLNLLKRYAGVKKSDSYALSSVGVSRFRNDDSYQIIDILPGIFRVSNSFISYPEKALSMNISYQDFVSVSGEVPFPSKIVLEGIKNQESIVVTLSISSVDIDGGQSISFLMPSNYEKVQF